MMVGVQSKGSACAGAYESGVQDHVGRCKTAGARKDRRNLTRAGGIGAYSMAIEGAYIFQIHEKGGLYFLRLFTKKVVYTSYAFAGPG